VHVVVQPFAIMIIWQSGKAALGQPAAAPVPPAVVHVERNPPPPPLSSPESCPASCPPPELEPPELLPLLEPELLPLLDPELLPLLEPELLPLLEPELLPLLEPELLLPLLEPELLEPLLVPAGVVLEEHPPPIAEAARTEDAKTPRRSVFFIGRVLSLVGQSLAEASRRAFAVGRRVRAVGWIGLRPGGPRVRARPRALVRPLDVRAEVVGAGAGGIDAAAIDGAAAAAGAAPAVATGAGGIERIRAGHAEGSEARVLASP
jgi:hypothetical protein